MTKFIKQIKKINNIVKIHIGCPLTGYPELTIEWMFKGNAIETTNNSTKYRLMHNNKVLSISNFNNVSVGDYSCKGTNTAGSADASLQMKITSKFTLKFCTFEALSTVF